MEFRNRLAILAALLLSGCGGGGSNNSGGSTPAPPAAVTYTASSGVAQKGPLALGSTVTAQELSATLAPLGKQYSYQTNSDLGTFNPNSTFTSQYIGVNATGYYFDEATGANSSGPITLNGYADLSAVTVLNVNLLTTLSYQRIQKLVANSAMTFSAAQSQAESEVLAAFNIHKAGAMAHFGALDISRGTDGDKVLAAISSIFSYGNTSANLAALIANVQSDIGTNGQITSVATKATLSNSAQALNAATMAANLSQRYSSAGLALSAADIGNWIDQDGDGIVGKFEFRVADASQASIFTVPAYVTDPYAGSSISISAGRMSVNATPASGAVQIQAGDVVTLSPPASTFPDGVLTAYLMSGATKIAKVSFVSGLQSLAVTPADPTRAVGLTQQFTASGTFTDGRIVDMTASASWTSSTPAVAQINAMGSAVASSVGTTTIAASSGSVSGSTTLTVIAPTLQSISVTPTPITVGPGFSRQLTATGHYSDGSSGDLTATAVWTTGNSTVATVTSGLVTGAAAGVTTVSAVSGTVSGSAALSVTAGQWTAAASNVARVGHTATLLANGKVFVAKGQGGFGLCCSSGASLYDPATDTWSGTGTWEFGFGTMHHTATLLPNGKVLLAGGDGNPTEKFSELYDPATNSWSSIPSMAEARQSHTATLLPNGKVLVAGGAKTIGGNSVSATAELYDPVANTWSSAGTMSTARQSHTATLLADGKVLIAGGGTVVADIYDPATNSWTATASMAAARTSHAAALLPDGKVLVAGGNGLSSAEIYDPATHSWMPAASMTYVRSQLTATTLTDGTVMVVGGVWAQVPATAEIYNATTDSWSAAPNLINAHFDHTATLLPSGAVLVIGGSTPTALATGTAELYW